jgi:NADPH:quinone reductase-like Zn-dependent oxidoreductase
MCTVWSNVFMTAGLRPGEVLLVHGGAGGVGTAAVQLGRVVGATVAVTAGTPEKLDLCRSLGASVLVNYNEDDFVTAVRQATDGHGADVVLDNMGAAYLARNVSVLAANGRLVVIGLQGGREASLDLSALMAKRAALIATTLRARPAEEKATIVAAVREHVCRGGGAPHRRGRGAHGKGASQDVMAAAVRCFRELTQSDPQVMTRSARCRVASTTSVLTWSLPNVRPNASPADRP